MFGILFGLYRLGHRAIDIIDKKLFDEKYGWIPKWFTHNEEFQTNLVSELKDHNAAQLLKCEHHGQILHSVKNGAMVQRDGISAMLALSLAIIRTNDVIIDADKQRLEETIIAAKNRLDSYKYRDD